MSNPIKNFLSTEYDLTNPEKPGKNLSSYIPVCLLGVAVFVVYYKFSFNMVSLESLNDLKEHTYMATQFYLDPKSLWNAWLQTPYFLWFITVKALTKIPGMTAEFAAANACAFYALLCYVVTVFLGHRLSTYYLKAKDHLVACSFLAFALSFAWPLYVPFLFPNQYLGQFALNPFHNATHMSVKWVGMLCVAMAVDLFRTEYGKEAIFFKSGFFGKAKYILFSVLLLVSVCFKPTFAFMFLPAGIVFLITELIRLKLAGKEGFKTIGKLFGKLLLACLPAVAYIILEYVAFYLWGDNNGDSRVALAAPFTAWGLFSNNIFLSVVVAMAFPLWMVISDPKYFLQSLEGKLALICYIVGFAEFTFFVETDYRLSHLNFAWEYMAGMLVFYVFAGAWLLVRTFKGEGKFSKIRVLIGWGLLFAHMFAGFNCVNPAAYIL